MQKSENLVDSEPPVSLETQNQELKTRVKELEAAVYLLQDEKENLIENFQTSTNILIERIKKLEEQVHGQRPQTAQLMRNIDQNQGIEDSLIEGSNDSGFIFKKQVKVEDLVICHNCQRKFTQTRIKRHTIVCYR